MAPHKKNELIKKLKAFITIIGQCQKEQISKIARPGGVAYESYVQLHRAANDAGLSENDLIEGGFSSEHVAVMRHLELTGGEIKRLSKALSLIVKDQDETLSKMVEYVKSAHCFEMIQGKTVDSLNKSERDVLASALGSLFGIEISSECVKSFRTEQIGSVIGYALSGLCTEHLNEFGDRKPNESLDDYNFRRFEFLHRKIAESDLDLQISLGDNYGGSCSISIGAPESKRNDGTRGKELEDHCFINGKSQTIHVGFSTSNSDLSWQGNKAGRKMRALKQMVELEYIDGAPNPYFGYTIEPYYLVIPQITDKHKLDENGKLVKQESGRDFIKNFESGMENESIRSLFAKLPYVFLYGNCVNHSDAIEISRFNAFLPGCDSKDIYEFAMSQSFEMNEKSLTINVLELISNTLVKAFEEMSNFNFKNDKNDCNSISGLTIFRTILENSGNLLKNLHVIPSEPISFPDYERLIVPLMKSVKKLDDELSAAFHGEENSDVKKIVEDILRYDTLPKAFDKKKIKASYLSFNEAVATNLKRNFAKPAENLFLTIKPQSSNDAPPSASENSKDELFLRIKELAECLSIHTQNRLLAKYTLYKLIKTNDRSDESYLAIKSISGPKTDKFIEAACGYANRNSYSTSKANAKNSNPLIQKFFDDFEKIVIKIEAGKSISEKEVEEATKSIGEYSFNVAQSSLKTARKSRR